MSLSKNEEALIMDAATFPEKTISRTETSYISKDVLAWLIVPEGDDNAQLFKS